MINTKNIITVTLAVFLIVIFTIYAIINKGYDDIEQYRSDEILRIKQSLKDYVDIAYATIEANHTNIRNKAYLEKHYGPRMKSVIDVAETIINTKAEAVQNGNLTLADAQEQAKLDIKKIRYDNGNSYVWLTDTSLPYPKMLMHPTIPSLDDQVLDDPKYNCASGNEQNRFSAAVEICQANGKGFVDYLWPKETEDGFIPDVPKLAYMRLFEKWNWTLSTAVYVDEAIKNAIEKSKTDIRRMKYNNGVGYLWINNPNKMIVHTKRHSLEEQILKGELKNQFDSFLDYCKQHNGSGHPNNQDELSYVKMYTPLNWVVGAAISKKSVEQAIEAKIEYINKQNNILILSILLVAVIVILLISGLIYIMNRFSSNETPQTPKLKVRKLQAVPTKKIAASEDKMLLTEDCIKMVQEISKTLIAEHAKLLTTSLAPQAKQILTQKSQETIERVRNKVPSPTHSNTVMGNLDDMFGE